MKKYIIKSFFIVTVLLTVTTSCDDTFIDEAKSYSIDSETYFNSEDEYNTVDDSGQSVISGSNNDCSDDYFEKELNIEPLFK